MAKTLSGCRICVISPRTWSSKKWTREQIEKWVKQAGGAFHKEFEKESTTHLVVEEQVWKNKTMAVQIALEAIDNGRKVYIVTPQWLEDCLTTQKKLREREFLWERIDQEAAGDQRKKRGKQAGEGEGEDGGEDGEGGARSHQAMLGEVLQEGTEEYVGDHDRRVFEAENAQRQRAEKELQELEARRKEQEKQALKEQRKVHSDLMKKTAKGGRGDVFKANHHVYKDTTGFEYDCTLTKVDTLTNTNERIVLTLYESNNGAPGTDNPPTYATNMHFAGTGKQPRNNVLAACESNYFTAMRMWSKAFMEKTGVHWGDRIKAHNERVRDRARDGDTPGLYSTRRGENGDIKSKTRAAEDAVPFEKRKFEYMPPLHAARGYLPNGVEQVPEVLRQMRVKSNEQRERTEQWTMMSGANGYGPEDPSSSPRQSIENARPVQIDLTEDDPADELDALATPGSGNGSGDDGTGAMFDAANVTATGVNGGPSSGMETGAYMNSLLVSAQDFSAQDETFNVGDLAGQQQQQFVFDQDNIDFEVEQPGMRFTTGMYEVGGGDMHNLPNQTQLATRVGEDLLDFQHTDSFNGESGTAPVVVVPEAERLKAAAVVGKRERDQDEAEAVGPAAKAKRFMGEGSEDGGLAA